MIGRKYFLNASKGKFFERFVEGETPVSFDSITGHLVNITFKTIPQGDVMRLHIVDDLNFYLVSMFVHSRPAKAFFRLVKNLDFHSPTTFCISTNEGKDFFSVYQYSKLIPWFYSPGNSQDIPPTEEGKREFFTTMILNEVIPSLQKKKNPFPNHFFYKPSGNGVQNGYFSNQSTYVKPVIGDPREGERGFGKEIM